MSNEFLEGNKLIAEFMGRKLVETPWPHKPFEEQGYWVMEMNGDIESSQFKTPIKYHSSWDWLMPVVEKIESMDCVASFSIDFHNACIFKRNDGTRIDQISNQTNNKIEAVYKTVVEFIKWYNQNK